MCVATAAAANARELSFVRCDDDLASSSSSPRQFLAPSFQMPMHLPHHSLTHESRAIGGGGGSRLLLHDVFCAALRVSYIPPPCFLMESAAAAVGAEPSPYRSIRHSHSRPSHWLHSVCASCAASSCIKLNADKETREQTTHKGGASPLQRSVSRMRRNRVETHDEKKERRKERKKEAIFVLVFFPSSPPRRRPFLCMYSFEYITEIV